MTLAHTRGCASWQHAGGLPAESLPGSYNEVLNVAWINRNTNEYIIKVSNGPSTESAWTANLEFSIALFHGATELQTIPEVSFHICTVNKTVTV